VWIGYDQPRTIVSNGYAGELAVPLWGRFMKIATRDDEPEWFRAPSNVGSATICRLSGKRATSACRDVETVDENGNLTRQSMAYTEHFVRGTEPHEDCPLHTERRGVFATLFGLGRDDSSRAAPAGAVPAPPAVAAAPASPAPPAATVSEPPPQQPERKRGFWSRLFGRRDNNRDQPKQDEQRRDRSR
jgi:membrane peptidoglycan carboxypeptidase